MEAKAIESIDSIALTCRTISSDHVQIDLIPGGAILIFHDNRDGRRRGRSRQPRKRMSSCLAAWLLRRKITPCYETLSTGGAPGPPEASDVRPMMVVDHGRRFRPAEMDAIVESYWTAF